jgi:hypothetical protein
MTWWLLGKSEVRLQKFVVWEDQSLFDCGILVPFLIQIYRLLPKQAQKLSRKIENYFLLFVVIFKFHLKSIMVREKKTNLN